MLQNISWLLSFLLSMRSKWEVWKEQANSQGYGADVFCTVPTTYIDLDIVACQRGGVSMLLTVFQNWLEEQSVASVPGSMHYPYIT